MKISVVIPFYNAGRTLDLCLNALAAQSLPPLEVIMVDNNSKDGSGEIAKQFAMKHSDTFHYFFESRQGPSFARNCGAERAKGDIVAFTDADCISDRHWLSNLSDGFKEPRIGAVAGRVVAFGTASIFDKFHAMFTMRGSSERRRFKEFTLLRGGFPTANLGVRREVFNRIEGFDESMKIYSEDYDLCARVYEAGFAIEYIPEALIFHKHRNTLEGTWRQSFGFGTGHAVLLEKHFKRLVIIDLPKYQYISKNRPIRVWLNLTSADKKLLVLLLLSIAFWPLSGLLAFYLLFLYGNMAFRLRQSDLKAGFIEKWQLVFLLLCKSAAMTMGRIVGSFRNKVCCF